MTIESCITKDVCPYNFGAVPIDWKSFVSKKLIHNLKNKIK